MPLLACLLAGTPWLSAFQYAHVDRWQQLLTPLVQQAHDAGRQLAAAGAD